MNQQMQWFIDVSLRVDSSELIDAMNGEEYKRFLEYQIKATHEPTIAGTSLHGLWIGRVR